MRRQAFIGVVLTTPYGFLFSESRGYSKRRSIAYSAATGFCAFQRRKS